MSSAGAIVWISVRPLIRLFLNVGAGFALTKADLFPVVAARGAGQIILNVALPCLMFSRIVPAFTSQNIHNLGPLVLVAIIYEALGMALAWLVTQFFWVPHRFRYGILVAGAFGNVGDIPTSVIMSITASAPFSGAEDQNLAVAYIAAFILVFFITLFPMGGHRLILKDYVGPDIEPEEVREMMRLRRKKLVKRLLSGPFTHRRCTTPPVDDLETASGKDLPCPEKSGETEIVEELRKEDRQPVPCQQNETHRSNEKHVAFLHDDAAFPDDLNPASHLASPAQTITHVDASRMTSPAPTITHIDEPSPPALPLEPTSPANPPPLSSSSMIMRPAHPHRARLISEAHAALRGLLTPCSLTIIIAFPIALITPLKALFKPIPHSPIPNAPDGQPPLAFLLDTATFIGAASVPIGLITLGSALARLKVARGAWANVPRGAIGALAVGKMVLTPVLGVLIVRGLVGAGVIDADDKVLQFVCIFLSCLPTATTQVFLTQVYSGTGTAEHLSAFLIPQYAIMFVTMTALTAYTLQLLF